MATRSNKHVKRLKKLPVWLQVTIIILVVAVIIFGFFYYDANIDPLSNWFNAGYEGEITEKAEGELRVHFIDVGQGDAIVAELPDDKILVVDGGPRDAKKKVLEYIHAMKVTTIDYMVLTHTDEDHVGSLDDVVKEFDVKNIYMPKITTSQITTTVYKQFVDAVGAEKANIIYSGDNTDISGGSYIFDFYTMEESQYEKVNKNSSAETKNSVSPLIFLNYANKKVLFTGDANKETEEDFLKCEVDGKSVGNKFDVDVLKVGHHGSQTSSIAEFLDVVKPEYSVVMAGEGNKYQHPRQDTLDRLNSIQGLSQNQQIYRTDYHGDVVLTISPDSEGNGSINFATSKTSTLDVGKGANSASNIYNIKQNIFRNWALAA